MKQFVESSYLQYRSGLSDFGHRNLVVTTYCTVQYSTSKEESKIL
jgi:hypothetical protein